MLNVRTDKKEQLFAAAAFMFAEQGIVANFFIHGVATFLSALQVREPDHLGENDASVNFQIKS